jgi:mRNA-degrading endonuclease RelE of RelBE toxin-antitoxin system
VSSSFSSRLTPRAAYEFRHLSNRAKARLGRAIEGLLENPIPTGAFALDNLRLIYRLKVNNHRVVYQIREISRVVVVLYIQEWPEIRRD